MGTDVWILVAVVVGFWCVLARMHTWQRQLGTQLEILLDREGYLQRQKEEREFNQWQRADSRRQGGLSGWIGAWACRETEIVLADKVSSSRRRPALINGRYV